MKNLPSQTPQNKPRAHNKGFILILVVGALAVLVILGMSFAEQSRIDMLGSSNARDIGAVDGLGETGFQIGLQILKYDRSVDSDANPLDTPGITSRWGFNPYHDTAIAVPGTPFAAPGYQQADVPQSRANPRNFLDSWQALTWSEARSGSDLDLLYKFTFDTNAATLVPPRDDGWIQRHPTSIGLLMDNWQLQPLARVKKWRVKFGSSYGLVQVAISPRDGGINVNDVFDPTRRDNFGAAAERPGWHDSVNARAPADVASSGLLPVASVDRYAAPDRRTLEYVLGKRPEFATRLDDLDDDGAATSGGTLRINSTLGKNYIRSIIADKNQFVANQPAGSVYTDNGVYNYRSYFEASGRSRLYDANGTDPNAVPSYEPAWLGHGRLFENNKTEPMIFHNNAAKAPNRYNFEGSRYVLFASTMGMSMKHAYRVPDTTRTDLFRDWYTSQWWMPGRYMETGIYPATTSEQGPCDVLFQGFGFDLQNPARGGVGVTAQRFILSDLGDNPYIPGFREARSNKYIGAGVYGHPKPRTFQRHFLPAVAGGRYWTDLMASWYFGGAPGYTSSMGATGGDRTATASLRQPSNWVRLGSSYDSLGMGSHWMPPVTHVWGPAFFGIGVINTSDITRGLLRHPGNMLPTKPAATYVYPLTSQKGDDKAGHNLAHFTYSNNRIGLRASGIQENWGMPGAPGDNQGRFYDAINVNVTNYQVVYGLLTPEKIPSMVSRTTVAPHLHWKARLLDGAYVDMHTFARYDPNDPTAYPNNLLTTPIPGGRKTPVIPPPSAPNMAAIHPYYWWGIRNPDFAPPPVGPLWNLDDPSPYLRVAAKYDLNGLQANLFGAITNRSLPYHPASNNVLPWDPLGGVAPPDSRVAGGNRWDRRIDPSDYKYSLHRQFPTKRIPAAGEGAYEWFGDVGAFADPARVSRESRIWGKMDFTTPEPLSYRYKSYGTAGTDHLGTPKNGDGVAGYIPEFEIRRGSGMPQDDVFVATHFDLSLSPNTTNINGAKSNSSMMPRYSNQLNWSDWFLQRQTHIDRVRFRTAVSGTDTWVVATDIVSLSPKWNLGPALVPPPAPDRWVSGANNVGMDMVNVPAVKEPTNRRTFPLPEINSLYGIPNPNYLQLYPGSPEEGLWHWADQYRRYWPIKGTKALPLDSRLFDLDGAGEKTTHFEWMKVDADDPLMTVTAGSDIAPEDDIRQFGKRINPLSPVAKGDPSVLDFTNPAQSLAHVPAVNKDEAWRLTRIGRKYQEIIADEIMDYQVNPWWPNPCAMMTGYPGQAGFPTEVCVPLMKFIHPAVPLPTPATPRGLVTQNAADLFNGVSWQSYWEANFDGNGRGASLRHHVPDYFSQFNRFWMRAALLYSRNNKNATEGYHVADHPVEDVGIYPQPHLYFGQIVPVTLDFQDFVKDFPANTLEDQTGSEWRYLTGALDVMKEKTLGHASARNHPFKHWGDFVAMLGHLVYRSPMPVDVARTVGPTGVAWNGFTTRAQRANNGVRDPLIGVGAHVVCHGTTADPRNQPRFFDGSVVAASGNGNDTADALQGHYMYNPGADNISAGAGGRTANQTITVLDGYWPISANYALFPGPYDAAPVKPEDMLYPALPPNWPGGAAQVLEWQRRIDEWRGRDASGLRVEHHYISEAAANDVLVSFSNGRIGPIDFDGDGHVTMTTKRDLPYNTVTRTGVPPAPYPALPRYITDANLDATTKKTVVVSNRYWNGFPWNNEVGLDTRVTSEVPWYANNEIYRPDSLAYGIKRAPNNGAPNVSTASWQYVNKNEVIQNCVTLPIKFRSNTFRVSVVVELTDSSYRNVYGTHRYSRVYSRIPAAAGTPMNNVRVNGRYGGEFILHSSRSLGGVDPETSWLGVE